MLAGDNRLGGLRWELLRRVRNAWIKIEYSWARRPTGRRSSMSTNALLKRNRHINELRRPVAYGRHGLNADRRAALGVVHQGRSHRGRGRPRETLADGRGGQGHADVRNTSGNGLKNEENRVKIDRKSRENGSKLIKNRATTVKIAHFRHRAHFTDFALLLHVRYV